MIGAMLRHRHSHTAMLTLSLSLRSLPALGLRSMPVHVEVRSLSAIATSFDAMVETVPLREAVRYTKKNLKWQSAQLKTYVDAQANAFTELGLSKGDTLAVCLPESAEKNVTQLAAAKVGLIFADVDVNISSVDEIRQVLTLTQPRAIIVEPVSESHSMLRLLRRAIPELVYYDDSYGKPFHSKHFPKLKYFIHTGFDLEIGFYNYKHLFLYNPPEDPLPAIQRAVPDDAPLYVSLTKAGSGKVNMSAPLSHAQVLQQGAWPTISKILSKQFIEI